MQVLTFTIAYDWPKNHAFTVCGQQHDLVDHLTDRLRLKRNIVIWTARCANTGEQQTQVIVDLGNGTNGGTWVMRSRLLLD